MKTAVEEKPILFSSPMVRAILAGRKTMTRRVVDLKHVLTPDQKKLGFEQCDDPKYFRASLLVKGVPRLTVPVRHPLDGNLSWDECDGNCLYARWEVGDRLWVRENYSQSSCWTEPDLDCVAFQADGAIYRDEVDRLGERLEYSIEQSGVDSRAAVREGEASIAA